MQCIFLFRDAQGRLPTARELSRRGFVVSRAVQPAEGAPEVSAGAPGEGPGQPGGELLRAAESPAGYGARPVGEAEGAAAGGAIGPAGA